MFLVAQLSNNNLNAFEITVSKQENNGGLKIPSQTIRQSLYFMKALLQLAQPNPIGSLF